MCSFIPLASRILINQIEYILTTNILSTLDRNIKTLTLYTANKQEHQNIYPIHHQTRIHK